MAKKELGVINQEQIDALNEAFPVTGESNRVSLPRFGMLSKDITEVSGTGKNKKVNIIQSAGSFYTEKDEGEVDPETGKKVWTKNFIDGETVDVIIAFHRRQLRMYDASLEKFYSTPVFDNATQVLPLYLDKQVVMRGTQLELQAKFPHRTLKGKPSSKLKEETILYVVYEGEMYQMNLSQSSKWTFKDYARQGNPSLTITTLGSIEDTFGDNTFSKVTFTKGRMISSEEFEIVSEGQNALKETVEQDATLFIAGPATEGNNIEKF